MIAPMAITAFFNPLIPLSSPFLSSNSSPPSSLALMSSGIPNSGAGDGVGEGKYSVSGSESSSLSSSDGAGSGAGTGDDGDGDGDEGDSG